MTRDGFEAMRFAFVQIAVVVMVRRCINLTRIEAEVSLDVAIRDGEQIGSNETLQHEPSANVHATYPVRHCLMVWCTEYVIDVMSVRVMQILVHSLC